MLPDASSLGNTIWPYHTKSTFYIVFIATFYIVFIELDVLESRMTHP